MTRKEKIESDKIRVKLDIIIGTLVVIAPAMAAVRLAFVDLFFPALLAGAGALIAWRMLLRPSLRQLRKLARR